MLIVKITLGLVIAFHGTAAIGAFMQLREGHMRWLISGLVAHCILVALAGFSIGYIYLR